MCFIGRDVNDGAHASREVKLGKFRVIARALMVIVSGRAVMIIRACRRYVDMRFKMMGFIGNEDGIGTERR